MEHLPIYIKIVFILTALLSLWLLYKATNQSKAIIITVLAWLGLQTALSLTGFYTVSRGVPPRFALLLVPPLMLLFIGLITPAGRKLLDGFDIKWLTLIHIVRVPIEITLYWLFLHKTIPGIMTFEGHNFDILAGLTAPLVYYLGYVKNALHKNVILAWNIICLLLLINIVVTAVLSAPFHFQKLAFNQPNIALFYFPFTWLPAVVVPAALMAHLVSIRQLLIQKS
ncbi:hypothetical protein [Mucilaginibacter flavus]|uniref:hypothetical protein n=1 Tax=Mucilaginibacter flavus TaxID=931504 RepID=UPI0025B4E7AA|nr:hypothetical protein [Mucilaginibacter flavus]MDN3580805.1 hypothetical protein [Mucilaginibacter flavus]